MLIKYLELPHLLFEFIPPICPIYNIRLIRYRLEFNQKQNTHIIVKSILLALLRI